MRARAIAVLGLSMVACVAPQDRGPSVDELDPTDPVAVDEFIEAKMALAHVPGLSACIVKDGAVAWCRAYGEADVGTGRAVTEDTPFLIASVSKLVTTTAVMQAVEGDGVGLGDPVQDHVGFSVQHPDGGVITVEQLLTHTGAVADADVLDSFYVTDGDPTISLAGVCQGYFDPAGDYYDAGANFHGFAPGTAYEYTNMGYALLGQLAASAAGEDFAVLTRARIFDPLGMEHTGWYLGDFGEDELAMPHEWDGERYVPTGQYTFADYPNGGLRSTAPALARFAAAFARGGELEGARILQGDTVEGMFEVAFPELEPDQALGWAYFGIGDDEWIGHEGGEQGVFADLALRPRDGTAFVVLANGEGSDVTLLYDIEDALIRVADEAL